MKDLAESSVRLPVLTTGGKGVARRAVDCRRDAQYDYVALAELYAGEVVQ